MRVALVASLGDSPARSGRSRVAFVENGRAAGYLICPSSRRVVRGRRDVAQSGSAPEWGSGGRGFKSRRPDSVSVDTLRHQLMPWVLICRATLAGTHLAPTPNQKAKMNGPRDSPLRPARVVSCRPILVSVSD